MKKRSPVRIRLPEPPVNTGEEDATFGGAGGAPEPSEASWVVEGSPTPNGIYQDPENRARFHRRGRGGRPGRTVRRVTVYLPDELVTKMDVYVAKTGRSDANRSSVIELALERLLATVSTG